MLSLTSFFSFSSARKLLFLGVAGGSLAVAQEPGRFCLGGDLEHLSPAQRTACSANLAAVRTAAQRYGAPAGWHFVMVCGEEGWKVYAPFSRRAATELQRASADTDLTAHSTYFREDRLQEAGIAGSSERIVAREIAGIVLQTSDDAAIEARVELWMHPGTREAGYEVPVLRASR